MYVAIIEAWNSIPILRIVTFFVPEQNFPQDSRLLLVIVVPMLRWLYSSSVTLCPKQSMLGNQVVTDADLRNSSSSFLKKKNWCYAGDYLLDLVGVWSVFYVLPATLLTFFSEIMATTNQCLSEKKKIGPSQLLCFGSFAPFWGR